VTPLALYVHIPWCAQKCPYCDFNSHQQRGELPEQRYLAQLLADLETDVVLAGQRKLSTLFVGGGTPSLMSAAFYQALLEGIDQRIGIARDAEITLEANPGSSEYAKFRDFRTAGINRLSIGVQSFNNQMLAMLGRIHDADTAHIAIRAAQSAGFDRLNIDLMHGLPGQNPRSATHDLTTALQFETGHISWYQLTIERNTAFWRSPPILPVDDILADIQDDGLQQLDAAGYAHYEVSAFARDAHRCRHNLNYWQFGDYLGIGAGAHGKLSLSDGTVLRTRKTRVPEDYLNHSVERLRITETVPTDELPLEFLMNALRLRDGVPMALFEQRTGHPIDAIIDTVNELRHEGLLVADENRLQSSALGFRFLDSVLTRFS